MKTRQMTLNRVPLFICASGLALALVPAVMAQETIPVPRKIVEELKKDSEMSDAISVNPDGSARNLVAIPVDLNDDGKPELIVHGIGADICGAQNCSHWIYRQTGDVFLLLLDANVVQHIEVQKGKTKRYHDVMTAQHSSALESALTLYKFDGKQYRSAACFWRTYWYADKQGNLRDWDSPRISRVECSGQ